MVFNPYLPLTEYIPDGEPHVFGDRVYIFGSHDKAGGKAYCEQDYTVWSAPVDNLGDWRCEGVSYRKTQDPSNADGAMQLWAPDVTQGPDGRYYLYYCFSFYPEIGVAVSDSPTGPYEFYGHVHYPPHIREGNILQEYMVFDPAVLTDEDGRVWLYYGFAPACEKEMKFPDFTEEELSEMPPEVQKRIRKLKGLQLGENGMVVELEPDMLTTKEEPRVLIPGGHHTAGTGFEGHGFFEASSIRKIRGKYYFVYSSHKSHELCYAVSDRPDGGFRYGGTIISNGDVGLKGRETPCYPIGNNHGGLVEIGDALYIFYHRQTDGTEFSRQGCAERVELRPDGSIPQAEKTSCGLNNGPLPASGSYPAGICCHLTDPTIQTRIDYTDPILKTQARVTERSSESFITDIKDGTVIGYKYFAFRGKTRLLLELRGDFDGAVSAAHEETLDHPLACRAFRLAGEDWSLLALELPAGKGALPLYLRFSGKGQLEFKRFAFLNDGQEASQG